jgi:ribosomal protein L33
MFLIDIENLDYEMFNFGDDTEPVIVNYISEENLRKAPRVDPISHAGVIIEIHRSFSTPEKLHVTGYCSNCNEIVSVDMVPEDLWEAGYKDTYKPNNRKYCSNCGHKLDKEVNNENLG